MITLRCHVDCEPVYMTPLSSNCDLQAREGAIIEVGQVSAVATGVWIDQVDHTKVPAGMIPEIQIRCRSSLAFKRKVILANGIGTVDADYPDEIKVLLMNVGTSPVVIEKGERIAQMCLNLVCRFPEVTVRGESRTGGFGSTGNDAPTR
jgi:dUTP pyrophosphatase